MTLADFLNTLGVKANVIVAAFGGAVARIALFPAAGAGVVSTVTSILGGTLTAVYLGPVLPAYLGWQENGKPLLAATFVVGLAGMEICKQVIVAASKWSLTIGKGPKDA